MKIVVYRQPPTEDDDGISSEGITYICKIEHEESVISAVKKQCLRANDEAYPNVFENWTREELDIGEGYSILDPQI